MLRGGECLRIALPFRPTHALPNLALDALSQALEPFAWHALLSSHLLSPGAPRSAWWSWSALQLVCQQLQGKPVQHQQLRWRDLVGCDQRDAARNCECRWRRHAGACCLRLPVMWYTKTGRRQPRRVHTLRAHNCDGLPRGQQACGVQRDYLCLARGRRGICMLRCRLDMRGWATGVGRLCITAAALGG